MRSSDKSGYQCDDHKSFSDWYNAPNCFYDK